MERRPDRAVHAVRLSEEIRDAVAFDRGARRARAGGVVARCVDCRRGPAAPRSSPRPFKQSRTAQSWRCLGRRASRGDQADGEISCTRVSSRAGARPRCPRCARGAAQTLAPRLPSGGLRATAYGARSTRPSVRSRSARLGPGAGRVSLVISQLPRPGSASRRRSSRRQTDTNRRVSARKRRSRSRLARTGAASADRETRGPDALGKH